MPTKQLTIHTITAALLVPVSITFAEKEDRAAQENTTWIGVITTDDTNVRCGANESYYTIATANSGDFVRVHGNRQDWMKIDASGNVFVDTVGYIKYPADEILWFETSDDVGTVKSDLEVLAKNTDSDELYRSWRPVLRLQNGDQVKIVESIITEPGTLHRDTYVVHTIQMPQSATGWVNGSNITRATPEQTAAYYGTEYVDVPAAVVATGFGGETLENETNTPDVPDEVSSEVVFTESTTPASLEPLTLAELEHAWKKMASEPVMGAEVSPLKDMYNELLSKNSEDIVIEQLANGRIRQLDVWAGLQNQRVRIESLRAHLAEQSEEVTDYQSVMALFDEYAIAGRLALSNTFDGRLRPFMYRIQDPKSGRTLGYLPANEDWELSGLVGQIIGVVGKRKWDPNWRVNVVEANRFDILSPTTATVTTDIQ
jgi:hypothetical protein